MTKTICKQEDQSCSSSGKPTTVSFSWLHTLIIAACVAVFVVLGGWLFAGKPGAEKTLIRLVMPVGATWLVLWGWWGQFVLKRALRQARTPLAIWLVFTILTTSPLTSTIVNWLETKVVSYQPETDEPLDLLVVLGGGTTQGPWRAEAGGAGDRILYAAELYIQKHTRKLVATGDITPGVSRSQTTPREQTIEIWTKLGIAADDIETLNGINTYFEIQSLKARLASSPKLRVGLLTSASHLPRAVRLAKAQGLEVLPIAANHSGNIERFTYLDFIPSSGPLQELAASQHEIMASWVKR